MPSKAQFLSSPILNRVTTRKASAAMSVIVKHPQFRKLMREIRRTPIDNRLEKSIRLVTVEELVRRGIPVPKGTVVSLRVFEEIKDPEDPRTSSIESLKTKPVGPIKQKIDVCVLLPHFGAITIGTPIDIEIEVKFPK